MAQERAKRLLQLRQRAEARVVVELDVRQHARSRPRGSASSGRTRRPRPPATRPPPTPRSASRRPIGAPTSQPGSQAGGAQRVHDHRRGRRLAVRARHRDRAPQRAQLAPAAPRAGAPAGPARAPPRARGSPPAPRSSRSAPRPRPRARSRRRGRPAPPAPRPPRSRSRYGRQRAVGAAHLGAERVRRARVAAHPGAADADEVQPPPAPRLVRRLLMRARALVNSSSGAIVPRAAASRPARRPRERAPPSPPAAPGRPAAPPPPPPDAPR